MLERLYEQQQAVTAYAAENDVPTLKAFEYTLVTNVIRVLKPFDEMSKQASAEHGKISYITPAVATLHSYLSKRMKDSEVQTMKEQLKKAVEKRFQSTGNNVLTQKCYVVATVLDPRFKTKFLEDEVAAKRWVVEEIIENERKQHQCSTSSSDGNTASQQETITTSATPPNDSRLLQDTHGDIWHCFDQIAIKDNSR